MSLVTRCSVKGAATFCYVWLMLGFLTGTIVLLGPVRWLTNLLRGRGYAQHIEDLAILGIIAVYVVSSALLARWIVRRTSRCHTRTRVAVPTLLTVAAAVCLWGWMNPAHLFGAAPAEGGDHMNVSGAEFSFGPYPDRARLEELKNEGYTAVISLQHPAVVPFEPIGIADEQKASKEIGIEFIHAPMLPWVSTNEPALNEIRRVAFTGKGKYYVHCGLGRDRVNVVKRMLETEGIHVATAEGYQVARSLDVTRDMTFERGDLREIEKGIWLLPYPNEHEYFTKFFAGQVAHVTLALDPDDPTQRVWVDEATRLFTKYNVPFDVQPLRADDAAARTIVEAARKAPRPTAVIVGFTDPFPTSTTAAHVLLNAFGASTQ